MNPEEEKLFKAITKIGKRPKFDVPTFSRNLNLEELIDWINELEEYFEYEEIEDLDRVRFVKAKLKCHKKILGRKCSWSEIEEEKTKSPNWIG